MGIARCFGPRCYRRPGPFLGNLLEVGLGFYGSAWGFAGLLGVGAVSALNIESRYRDFLWAFLGFWQRLGLRVPAGAQKADGFVCFDGGKGHPIEN